MVSMSISSLLGCDQVESYCLRCENQPHHVHNASLDAQATALFTTHCARTARTQCLTSPPSLYKTLPSATQTPPATACSAQSEATPF